MAAFGLLQTISAFAQSFESLLMARIVTGLFGGVIGSIVLAINASIQKLSGGLASLVAGHIVQVGADGKILHYDVAGYVVVATSLLTAFLLWRLQKGVRGMAVASV